MKKNICHRMGFQILSGIAMLIKISEVGTVKFLDICRRLTYHIICKLYFLN